MYSFNINREASKRRTAFDCVFHRIAEFNQYLFNFFSTKCVRCDFNWIQWNILLSCVVSSICCNDCDSKDEGRREIKWKESEQDQIFARKTFILDDKFFQAIKSFFGESEIVFPLFLGGFLNEKKRFLEVLKKNLKTFFLANKVTFNVWRRLENGLQATHPTHSPCCVNGCSQRVLYVKGFVLEVAVCATAIILRLKLHSSLFSPVSFSLVFSPTAIRCAFATWNRNSIRI